MEMVLGPKPTRKALEKNAHKNYILRFKVFKYVLEQLATMNGKDTSNFGLVSQLFTKEDGREIRQYFTVKVVSGEVIVDGYPEIFPLGIVWNMIEAYMYDHISQPVGIIKLKGKVKPIQFKGDKLTLVEWAQLPANSK